MICKLCGEDIQKGPLDTSAEGGVTYTLYECSTCSGQFWVPFKNPGAAWYEHDQRYADRNAEPILRPNKKHLDVMSSLGASAGRVLDVGCGVGNFLALAESRGWETWGVDFDRDAIAAAGKVFGLRNLYAGGLAEFSAANPDLRFELITFFDVFEHIDSHNDFLEMVHKLLSPGGRIALSVPYRHGMRWLLPHDLPPRHLTRWDEDSLRKILERHNFEITYSRRLAANLHFLALKFRFRYGAGLSLGLVSRVRKSEGQKSSGVHVSRRVWWAHSLAKFKDAVLFGLPALFLWLVLLPTRKRYTDIYLVAKMR